jgi:hypothetical protein
MDELRSAFLNGAKDYLAGMVEDLAEVNEQAAGEARSLIGLIDQAFRQAAAKKAKKDAEPMPKIKVGDELINVPQLDACPDNTILGDNVLDAWQKIEDRWYCTQPEMNNDGYASYGVVGYAPLTVLYLEDDE